MCGRVERERAIQRFQNDENCRVFLVSIKAGAQGCPVSRAVSIDRTRRIGQTKNIFAYRMICKDTIEDKIIQLQEKKRLLAKDLITDDEGFVKSLSRANLKYLFS